MKKKKEKKEKITLTVHDCLIVKVKDSRKVLEYCKSKYNNIDFEVSYL